MTTSPKSDIAERPFNTRFIVFLLQSFRGRR
jgi:hypothetical protein